MQNRIISLVILACVAFTVPLLNTGCSTAPDQRTQTVQTLKIVGQSAKTTMDGATQLLKQGSITVQQWQSIASFYDSKFQPAYALAVASARSDLSSIASPDLIGIAAQLSALVAQISTPVQK